MITKLMALGVLGEPGGIVPLHVAEEHVHKNEIVITLPHKMEGKTVTLMDLVT